MAHFNMIDRIGLDASPFVKSAQWAAQQYEKFSKSIFGSSASIGKSIKSASASMSQGVSTGASAAASSGAVVAMIAAGTIAAIRKVSRVAAEDIELFEAQATAQAQLAQVMRNTMSATQAEVQSVLDLNEALQKKGVIDADMLTSGSQELATYLSQGAALKELIPVLADMTAQQYGLNATSENTVNIATMMGKVMNGQVSALSRYGYSFTEAQAEILKTGNEMERAAVLAEVVTQSVGGMNEALGRTDAGRIVQLNNQWEAVRKTMGAAWNDLRSIAIPAIQTVVSWLQVLANSAQKAALFLRALFNPDSLGERNGIAGAVESSAESLAGAGETVAGSVGGAASKLQAATAGFDKLNILKQPSSGGGGGASASGIAVSDMMPAEAFDASGITDEMQAVIDKANKIREVVGKVVDWFNTLGENIRKLFTKEYWAEKFDGIRAGIEEKWNEVNTWFSGTAVGQFWNNHVKPYFTKEKWKEVWNNIVTSFPSSWAEFKTQWGNNISTWWNDSVKPWFTITKWQQTWSNIRTGFSNAWAVVKTVWDMTIGNWWNNDVLPKFTVSKWYQALIGIKTGFVNVVTNALKGGQELFNRFIDWINERMSFSWEGLNILGQEVYPSGSVQLFTIPHIQAFQAGGFPKTAELFWANENGTPEMIGRMGSRPTVASNTQIVAGIQGGVTEAVYPLIDAIYEAVKVVVAAIKENGGDVYMDGKKVTDEVTRRQQRAARNSTRNLGFA